MRSIVPRTVLAAAAVLLSSAGACQQEWEGSLPPPEDLGAAPLPEGTRRDGVEAIYATLASDGGEGGTSCYGLLRLSEDGTAGATGICTEEPVADVAASPETWDRDPGLGDYAWRDGILWTRIVEWDWLAEELVLTERVRSYCGTWLTTERERLGGGSELLVADLVAGDPPADVAPCP